MYFELIFVISCFTETTRRCRLSVFLLRYVQETVNINQLAPIYRQFARILEAFKIPDSDMKTQPLLDVSKEIKLAQELGAKNKDNNELKKVPKLPDEFDEDDVRIT